MKYNFKDVKILIEPQSFNKDSGKEILQYAVGGLLYMPASNTKIIKKLVSKEYEFVKSMVLDLEDSLGDDLVGYGQRNIKNLIDELKSAIESNDIQYEDIPLIFIRVREPNQILETYKLLGDNIKYITGFNIPKFDKTVCDEYIEKFTKLQQLVRDNVGNYDLYIMPIIESKNAMYRQLRMDNLLYMNDKLRKIQDNVLNVRVGGADFCSVFGIRRGIHDDIYDIGVVRSVLNDIINVFGKSYIVSAAVWEYFDNKSENTAWKDGLTKELYADRLNGFIGKTCIHPSQLPVVQNSLIVNKTDYYDALSILGMNTNTIGVKKSTNGDRMNEVKTHTNWAKKTIGLATIYGVKED